MLDNYYIEQTNMIEYQTEHQAVEAMHRTSIRMIIALVVIGLLAYFFRA
jgi:hypothetical protein